MINKRDIMGGLAKGLSVIETFSAERPRQSIAEAARASGLDRATTRRCLLTLAEAGYADYNGKFFTLTPRVLRLGIGCLASMPLPQLVQPLLDELTAAIGQSASVSILDGHEIVYVARSAQTKVMSISLMPGSRLPAFCTSMGRVLLASLPQAEAAEILHRQPLTARTPLTLTTPEAVQASLHTVRERGFAIIDQEVELGLRSIAVPLHSVRGQVVAALNIGLAVEPDVPASALADRFLVPLRAVQAELRPILR